MTLAERLDTVRYDKAPTNAYRRTSRDHAPGHG
jgi:hypothetical protein